MPPTISYRRGDIILVAFPFTDLSGSKQRPALVVSSDALNSTREDVVLVAISSQVPAAPARDEILIGPPDWKTCGLLKPSIVRTAKIVTLHQALLRKKIGSMPAALLQRVLATMQGNFQP